VGEAAPGPRVIFLETNRLVLRRFTEADVDLLVELDRDPEVMRLVNRGPPPSREAIEGDILPAFLGYYQRFPGFGFWAVIEKATGAFIGWFHLRPDPAGTTDDPELGYRFVSSAWGKGYATEGSRALIDKTFSDLGARRVVASTMAVNLRSRRVLEKAGLTLVRTLHSHGLLAIEDDAADVVEYALERAQWKRGSGGSGESGESGGT
jgi:RimJ/RimL family protein N-acetyltransferase